MVGALGAGFTPPPPTLSDILKASCIGESSVNCGETKLP
jgi:hypothetical protein